MQVAIVQFGGVVFNTHPLSLQQWGACTAIALGALPLRALITASLNASDSGGGGGAGRSSNDAAAFKPTWLGWMEMKLFRGLF
jgi:hypothetical protein